MPNLMTSHLSIYAEAMSSGAADVVHRVAQMCHPRSSDVTTAADEPPARGRSRGLLLAPPVPRGGVTMGIRRGSGPATAAIIAVTLVGFARSAEAGCGCQKPPPPVAEVRPNVTYAGTPVTLFGSSLVEGDDYDVTFTSSATGDDTTVSARVVNRRDLGDGVFKNQLVVPVPELPLGPAAIVARLAGRTSPAINIQDADFTV